MRFELVVVRAVLPAARVAVAEREERRTVALRRVRQRVHEAGPLVLSAYTEESSAHAVRELERKGVQVKTGAAVLRIRTIDD